MDKRIEMWLDESISALQCRVTIPDLPDSSPVQSVLDVRNGTFLVDEERNATYSRRLPQTRRIRYNTEETDSKQFLIQRPNLGLDYDLAKENLLDAVKNNQEENIKIILEKYSNLINDIYEDYNLPILYIVCKDTTGLIKKSVLRLLIDKGADLFYCSSKWGSKEAIHFAAIGQNPEILKVVVDLVLYKNSDGINAFTAKGDTAMHLLMKYNILNVERKEQCVEILLKNNFDPNLTDESNAPPIYYSSKNKFKKITQLFLDYGADVNYKDATKKSVADYITELNLDIVEKNIKPIKNLQGRLYGLLKSENFSMFKKAASDIHHSEIEAYKTLLQLAVEKNLINFVQFLLESGFDPNEVTKKNKNKPILLAAMKGHYEIFKILLEHPKILVKVEVLGELIKKIDCDSNVESSYFKCYKLLKSSNFIVSMQVNSLHTFSFDESKNLSFEEGALCNRKDMTTLKYKNLKNHLDQCIEADSNIFEENTSIAFNYTSLIPSGSNLQHLNLKSVQFVLSLSQSKQLKSLLAHPLISSFIFMNWLFCKRFLYTEIIFFTYNFLQLFVYQFSDNISGNMEVIKKILMFFNVLMLVWIVFNFIPRKVKDLWIIFRNFDYILVAATMLYLSTNFANTENQTLLTALLLLYTAMKILFLMGNFNHNLINIIIFKTVAWNYLKFLLMFSILLLAFSGTFQILLKSKSEPFNPLFRVILMLGGEFQIDDIDFNHYPLFSKIIFLTFIVIVSLTLLNLLNALAVSDTQEIKNEAELNRLIFRTKYIAGNNAFTFRLNSSLSFYYYIHKSKRLFVNKKGTVLVDEKILHEDKHGNKKIISAPKDKIYLHAAIMEGIKDILKSRHHQDEKIKKKRRKMENFEILNTKLNYLLVSQLEKIP